MKLRGAAARDAEAIARLHADSWRRHYRGGYSDEFLDGDVLEDRLTVWSARLAAPEPARVTLLAEDADGGLSGFVNAYLREDARWGALIDNLHVAGGRQRRGVGTRLLSAAGEAMERAGEAGSVYLWVLEQNLPARAFYEARGGRCAERAVVDPPGGVVGRLAGAPEKLRYVWDSAAALRAARSLELGPSP